MMEMLRQQREMMAMNQQLVATMLRRMDLEEERRNKAEEKVLEAAEAAKKAAVAAQTRDPFQPSTAPSSSTATAPAVVPPTSGFGGSNRAEKYLPNLPLDRPSRHGKRAHEGGGNVALLYGDFEFLACSPGRSVC